jgi:cytochrome b561
MRAETAVVWTRAQRRLHWLAAPLIALTFPLGWLMVAMPLRDLLIRFPLYHVHKTLGIIVFALVIVRLVLRVTIGRPDWDADLPRWQQRTAAAMHDLLYAVLLGAALAGLHHCCDGAAAHSDAVPPRHSHRKSAGRERRGVRGVGAGARWAAVLLVTLASGHAPAAWHNHRRGRASLVGMWRGRSSSSDASAPLGGTSGAEKG